ncbi:MAG TPA: ABC transporter permease [Acidimicrobiia bacterium]|jgi:putative ABC transport system permease protein|nr:ABC transporter permease [Acidimicrobiia bacterium]
MVPVARRMLFTDRRRAVLGVVGVAIALVMVLALDGIFAGTTRQVSRYIDTSPADVFVSQEGVRTIHMAISAIPARVVDRVSKVRGVAWAEPVLFASDALRAAAGRRASYVIGYQPGGRGGPQTLVEGRPPETGEMVIDDSVARALDINVGDEVEVLGRSWRVSGLTTGMTSIVNTSVYVTFDDLAQTLGSRDVASYILIGTGADPQSVADRVAVIPGVEAQTRPRFSAEERTVVKEMSTDLLSLMSLAALLVGLAVIGLVLYATIISRLRDIGVMKAIGLGRLGLTRFVLAQALWTIGTALPLAVAVTFGIGAVVAALAPDIDLVVESASLLRAGAGAVLVGAIGVISPLIKVWRVDPATVFRRAS